MADSVPTDRRAALPALADRALVVVTLAALVVAWLAGWRRVADGCWIAGTLVAVVPAVALVVGRGGRVWTSSPCWRWWAHWRCTSSWPAR